jgi:hypothetical protein
MMMYPGPTGSQENHKKGYCSDGVKPNMKGDTSPDWPQPPGIFELGTKFNPAVFLATLRDLYDKIVAPGQTGIRDDLSMEYEAFGKLLQDRIITAADGCHLFRLFGLDLPSSTPSELIVVNDGVRYMQINFLRDDAGGA